jgi:hypothetical protein
MRRTEAHREVRHSIGNCLGLYNAYRVSVEAKNGSEGFA